VKLADSEESAEDMVWKVRGAKMDFLNAHRSAKTFGFAVRDSFEEYLEPRHRN
jgi:hypothetical protein